jgi:hypothetical protein
MQYVLTSVSRSPITFNQPVLWTADFLDRSTDELLSVNYSTPQITAQEQVVVTEDLYNKYITLTTSALDGYTNVSYSTTVPALDTVEVTADSYELNGNNLTFVVSELFSSRTVHILGALTTATNQTSNATMSAGTNDSRVTFDHAFGEFSLDVSEGSITSFSVSEQGLASFDIVNLELGQKIQANITLPFVVPEETTFYLFKNISGQTISIPFTLYNQRVISLQLEDGVVDDDGLVNGRISDPLFLPTPQEAPQIRKSEHSALIEHEGSSVSLSTTERLDKISLVSPKQLPGLPTQNFEHDLLKFNITNLTDGKATIYLTYDELPKNPTLWKFNPATVDWYTFPYEVVNSTTLKLVIEDGGFGDDDGIINGVVVDDLGITNNWFNDSWRERKAFNITSTTTNLTNFEIQLTLTNNTFNFSAANDNLSDLRFTYYNASSDSELELSYFMESDNSLNYSNGATDAVFWINTPFLENNTATTHFIYYGNTEANSVSNASATFFFYEDFETGDQFDDGDLVLNRQSSVVYAGSFAANGSGTESYDSIGVGGLQSGRDKVFEVYVQSYDGGQSQATSLAGPFFGRPVASSATDGYALILDERDQSDIREPSSNSGSAVSGTYQPAFDTWYRIEGIWESNDDITFNLYTVAGGLLDTITKTDNSFTDGEFGLTAWGYAYFDNYMIRSYTATTPTVQFFGSGPGEGSELGGILNVTLDLPNNADDTIRFSQDLMNGTVECTRSSCGNVSVFYQYFSTASPTQIFSITDFVNATSNFNISDGNQLQLNSSLSSTPWWDASWRYRSEFNVTAPTQQTDMQYLVQLNNTVVGSNFSWADNSSLRFIWYNATSQVQNELPYYIESWNIGLESADIWVRFPIVNASVQLYYNATGVSSQSNASATFAYYNDFESGVGFDAGNLGLATTSLETYEGSQSVFGDGDNGYEQEVETGITLTRDYIYETYVRAFDDGAVATLAGVSVGTNNGVNNDGYQAYLDERGGGLFGIREDYNSGSVLDSVSGIGTGYDEWYFISFAWYSNTTLAADLYYANKTLIASISANDGTITSGEFGVGAYGSAYWDAYRVRKAPSASISFSGSTSEEEILFQTPGEFVSDPIDFGSSDINLQNITWEETQPSGTSVVLETRTSAGAQGAWFDADWPYRYSYTVSSSSTEYEYQILTGTNISSAAPEPSKPNKSVALTGSPRVKEPVPINCVEPLFKLYVVEPTIISLLSNKLITLAPFVEAIKSLMT